MSDTPAPASTTVCIAGCGPAGAMLSLMLARAGVDVVVLEQYPDFFRDFRGDTIHASTLQVLDELGLLPGFQKLPQQKTTKISMVTDQGTFTLGDFTQLPGKFQSLSMVPQWDFLDFITTEAEKYPTFRLQFRTRVVGLIEEDGVVRGVRYRTHDGEEGEIRALLTVAADGRHSTVRCAARLTAVEYGAPIDLLWYRVPKGSEDPDGSFARLFRGRFLPMIDRGDYWQGAYTMPKGTFEAMRTEGIESLRADLREAMPFLADRVDATLRSWDDTGFLEVRVNRLRRWYSAGVLCIGDAAHAMSPVAGVGINLAIQDAVAAANLLVDPLLNGRLTTDDLARVQRRRSLPARLSQLLQLRVQKQIISPTETRQRADPGVPPALRLMSRAPQLQQYFSRFMAIGVRNEHVRTPSTTLDRNRHVPGGYPSCAV